VLRRRATSVPALENLRDETMKNKCLHRRQRSLYCLFRLFAESCFCSSSLTSVSLAVDVVALGASLDSLVSVDG